MRRTLIVIVLLQVLRTGLAHADFDSFVDCVSLYAKGSNYYWDEHYNGKLLEERGPIHAIGAESAGLFSKGMSYRNNYRVSYKLSAEYFFGTVDYDGHTQDGTPAKTDVDYNGYQFFAGLGWNFKLSQRFYLEPTLGAGLKSWDRDIKSTGTAIGYNESWQVYYAKIGLNSQFVISSKSKSNLYAWLGYLVPIDVQNSAENLPGICGSIDLSPEPYTPSPFFEVGFTYKHIDIALFYESMRFDKSDIVESNGVWAFQPESHADSTGLTIKYRFF